MIAPKLRFSEFKDDLEKEKLYDLTLWSSGGTPSKANEEYWNGEIPLISGASMHTDKLFKSDVNITELGLKKGSKLAPKNSILILVRGSMLFNKIPLGIATDDVAFNQDVKCIRVKEKLSPLYLFQWFKAKEFTIQNKVTATGIGAGKLDTDDLQNLEIYLPIEKEQTKIAEFLSTVDDKISQLSRQLELLNQYKKGVMQKIFSQEIRFKNDNGEDFGEWDEKSIDEITEVVGGGTPSTSNQEYWDGEIVWLTPSEINRKYISKSKRTISIEGVNNSSAKILPKGTVLFTSRATIGEVAIAQNEVTTNQGFQSFIVKTDILNEFLYYWLIFNKNLFLERASGSTFLEVSKNSIKLITISLPPFLEQQKIAEFLTAIDERIDHTTAQLNHTKQWKKGLLQQMFV